MSDTSIHVNGEQRAVAAGTMLEGLIAEVMPQACEAADGRPRGVAAAVNGTVVARGSWSTSALRSGDTVEIVTAVQGG